MKECSLNLACHTESLAFRWAQKSPCTHFASAIDTEIDLGS